MCEPIGNNIDVSASQHFPGASGSGGLTSVSPLEPLDPTKFRNIMVEKHEVPSAFGNFCDNSEMTSDLAPLGQQQQSSTGPFVHPCFPPAAVSALHQSNPQPFKIQQSPSIGQQQQQQLYFVQQNAQGNFSSSSTSPLFGVRQMSYFGPGGASVQPNWNQQRQAQYINPQLGQQNSIMSPPKQQQQFVVANCKPSQPCQISSFPADVVQQQQQTIGFPPPPSQSLQNSPPVATKQELNQHQYHQQMLVQQQQQQQRYATSYTQQQFLSQPNPTAFPMGSNYGVVDHRQFMSQPCSIPSENVQNDPSTQQQVAVHQLKKTQSMLFTAPSDMTHQQQFGCGNPSSANFPSPSASFVHPSPSQDFSMVRTHHKHQQPMVRLPPSQQTPHAHLMHQISSQSLQFFGHDPLLAATLNPDICLAGCVFLLIDDCDPHLVDFTLLPSIIRFYGGDVESNNPRGIPERVTHVICSNWVENEALILQALTTNFAERMPRKMKRIVSLNWLNDAIAKRQVTAPSKACHLPSIWSSTRYNPKTFAKVIAVHGFTKREMLELKYMVRMIGARFSVATEQKSDFLVVNKSVFTENLCQLAARVGTVLVNFQWLLELYFGSIICLTSPDHQRFSPQNENASLTASSCSPLALSKVCEMCHKLLAPWSHSPISLNEEIIRLAHEMKYNLKNDIAIFPEKQFRISNKAPTEKQIEAAIEVYANSENKPKYAILFEGFFPDQIDCLSKKARFLGADIVFSVGLCTHFVTSSLYRTVNLLEAIALGKSVVTPLWVEASFRQLGFLPDLNFFVRDRENEKKYGFNLKATILRTRTRRVFKGVEFHLSSEVQPKYEIIRRLVEAAGGTVQKEKPKKEYLLKCIQKNMPFFIICDKNTLCSYQFLMDSNFPIFNEDFILVAILRHQIDVSEEFHAFSLNSTQTSKPKKADE
ncbi:hypothetical protein niasHS_017440 [Heterodera schachtii]|uniref:PAX-interacting protein 1 n=1 Tax=Heterodera schachtii TaxID=97005 RepID=A0ABD2I072_HETSC